MKDLSPTFEIPDQVFLKLETRVRISRWRLLGFHIVCLLNPYLVYFGRKDNDLSLCIFIIIQSIQFWYKHTICLLILYISAYCVHHQMYKAFLITLLSVCYASLHWPVITRWEFIVQICYLYKAYMVKVY
jgi:hypothetical protein